jgi:hypothetical protein
MNSSGTININNTSEDNTENTENTENIDTDDFDKQQQPQQPQQSQQPLKRRRGRPRKNQIVQQPIKKKRGRKPKDQILTVVKSASKVYEDEIVLHLPISMSDVFKYGSNATENSETEDISCNKISKAVNKIVKTSQSPQNIFTITDISYGSSTDESETYDDNYKELVEKIKAQDKFIKTLQDEIVNYKNIMSTDDKFCTLDKKIYKLDIDFIDIKSGSQVFLEKTDVACWWCTYNFDNMPCVIPEKIVNDTYHVFGCFCSYNCASAYNLNMGDYKVWDRYSLLKILYYFIFNTDIDIVNAPPKECLKKFGGYLSIEEFRAASIKNDKEYRLIMPNMKTTIPVIEENYKNGSPFINKIKSCNTSDQLVLCRTKPLPNSKNMLFETMGLVQKNRK